MLFQRLYNWIKYKTLPPSFLFKNRLFIERDSKHRRVLSNFGLTFRNSKWSNYEAYNIKTQFKNSYYRFMFFILFFFLSVFILINFNKYYILSYCFNSFSFLFWIGIDTIDYYISFLVWFFTITSSIFLNLIYSYFFFNNFSENEKNKKIFSNNFTKKLELQSKSNTDMNFISKHDLNLILYSWLTNSNSIKSSKTIDNLFENNLNSKSWVEINNFFNNLYKSFFFINLSKNKSDKININHSLTRIINKNKQSILTNDDLFITNLSYSENILHMFLNNYLFKNKSHFKLFNESSISSPIKNRFEWNLYNFNNEVNRYPFIIKSKLGFFFFNDLNYNRMSFLLTNFNELWSLNYYMKNQINTAKWNRWLYRYSILHRKILKNSHKITLSKRVLNSGIFDSNVFDKNIWNNQHLSKYSNLTQSSALFNLFYSDFLSDKKLNYICNHQNLINNLLTTNELSIFKNYENSYFWFLKRFYSFNTLPTNRILSKNKLKIENKLLTLANFKNNKNDQFNTIYSYLLKSNYLTHGDLNHLIQLKSSNYFINQDNNVSLSSNFKDIFILNNDSDLFSKDNLNTLYWISSNSTYLNYLSYFNYLSYKNQEISKISSNFDITKKLNNETNFYLFLSSLPLDNNYLNDILYLSLFY